MKDDASVDESGVEESGVDEAEVDESATLPPSRSRGRVLVAAVALLALAAVAFFVTDRLLDDSATEDMAGTVLSDGTILVLRDDTHAAAIDLTSSYEPYGRTATVVGFDSDGNNGLVVGLSLAADDFNTGAAIIHVPSVGSPSVVLEPDNGLLRVLGVRGRRVFFQELTTDDVENDTRTGVVAVDLETGAEERLATVDRGDAAVGGDYLLTIETAECLELKLTNLVDGSVESFEPYPSDPGCWDRGLVTDSFISADGGRVAYLRQFDGEMQVRIFSVDGEEEAVIDTPGVFSLGELLEEEVLEILQRDPVRAEVPGEVLSDRQTLDG